MPVLTQGQSASIQFNDADSVTIQAGSGVATFEQPTGAVTAIFSGTRTFGPYSRTTGRITATVQDVYYEFADGSGPVLPATVTGGAGGADQTAIREGGRISAASFVANIDSLSNQVTYRVSTGTYGFTYIAGAYFLDIKAGDNIDLAFQEWVAVVRPLAVANQGRVGTLTIPTGQYAVSSGGSTMTLEPWMHVKSIGGQVKINQNNATVTAPVFWFRADVTPLFSQGNDVATNTTPSTTAECNYAPHYVLDGRNGAFIVQGLRQSGSAGFRYGNGDGVWGTNFTTNLVNISLMSAVYGLHVMFMNEGLQFTNNNSFCSRWQNIWISNCDYSITTSTSAVDLNAYEQHSFIEFFSGNCYVDHILMRSAGARDHQFTFTTFSFTQCPGSVARLTAASEARLEFNDGRMENNLLLCASSVASPRSWFRMQQVTVIPTNTYNSLTTHLRKMFTGTFQVQSSNLFFDITGSPAWATVAIGKADNQFLADDTVVVQATNTLVGSPPGTAGTTGAQGQVMRSQAIWNKASNLIYNGDFEGTTLSPWTTGGTATFARTTTAGEFFDGSAACRITMSTQNATLLSEKFAVTSGKTYFGTLVARVKDNTPTPSANFFIKCSITWYAPDGSTAISTTGATIFANNQNWYNRAINTPGQWFQHSLGTGLQTAPIGAAFGRLYVEVGSTTDEGTGVIGGNVTGILYVDNACVTAL